MCNKHKLRFEKDGRTFLQNRRYNKYVLFVPVSYLGLSALLQVFGTKLCAVDRDYPWMPCTIVLLRDMYTINFNNTYVTSIVYPRNTNTSQIYVNNTLHRKIQTISWRPREGAHLANKALATARTRVKFSLLYSSVSTLPLWEEVMMARYYGIQIIRVRNCWPCSQMEYLFLPSPLQILICFVACIIVFASVVYKSRALPFAQAEELKVLEKLHDEFRISFPRFSCRGIYGRSRLCTLRCRYWQEIR